MPVGTRKAVDVRCVVGVGHSHGGVSIWQGRREKREDGSSKSTETSRMEPDLLVRRSSSVTVARAV